MTAVINFLEELQTRINSAMATGRPLASIKRLMLCSRLEQRHNDNMPIITINLVNCDLQHVYRRAGETERFTIEIILTANRLTADSNGYYKLSDTSGSLYLFLALRDVIQKTTAGVINLDYNNTVSTLVEMNTEINHFDEKIEYIIRMTAESNLFQVGSR